MTRRPSRAGFTLIELIIAGVVGSLIVLAAHRALVTNLRSYVVVNAQVRTQEVVRTAAAVLFSELRSLSPGAGDIIAMAPDSLTVRSMRTFGLVCTISLSGFTQQLTVRRVGDWFEPGDSVFILADNNVDLASDDVWLSGKISTMDTLATCASGDPAQIILLPGIKPAMTADSVRVGAPVRTYARYWYGLQQVDGEWYLTRREDAGTPEPLVGPLLGRSQAGLRFEYLDASEATTAVPADVAQVRVTIRAVSAVANLRGAPIGDSLTTYIFPRN